MKLPLIGITTSFFHPDPNRNLFKGKRLCYFEQTLAAYLWSAQAVPVPLAHTGDESLLRTTLSRLDGVMLSGGDDVAPASYREKPIQEAWKGDAYRDAYELRVVALCRELGIPLLGICRGAQLLNVSFGGTLYQDILTQVPGSRVHRDREVYDKLSHAIEILPGTRLAEIYSAGAARVNSVHHQAVKQLGSGLRISARSEDGIIEAIESEHPHEFLVAVQWHPEWMTDFSHLNPSLLIEYFLKICRKE